MDAAVSLFPLPVASLPPPPQHYHVKPSASASCRPPPARLAAAASPRAALRHPAVSPPPAAAGAPPRSSSRAATGYAAALADASLRAGALLGASRHARALLLRREAGRGGVEPDARVSALVRMLAGKGKAAMVADVMAEFAAICDHLLLQPPPTLTSSY